MAKLPVGTLLTITGPSGTPTQISIEDFLDGTPPTRSYKVAKYIPQNGANAGKEQVLAGSEEATQSTVTVVYGHAQRKLLEAMAGISGCSFVWTYADGATSTGTGVLSKISPQQQQDSQVCADQLTFDLSAGWAYDDTSAS